MRITEEEMITDEEIMQEPLVADSTALTEKIVSVIRGNRSRKGPEEQWKQ